jgi:hypothetical protein
LALTRICGHCRLTFKGGKEDEDVYWWSGNMAAKMMLLFVVFTMVAASTGCSLIRKSYVDPDYGKINYQDIFIGPSPSNGALLQNGNETESIFPIWTNI